MALLTALGVGSVSLIGIYQLYQQKSSQNFRETTLVSRLSKMDPSSLDGTSTSAYARTQIFLTTVKNKIEDALTANACPAKFSTEKESEAVRKARQAREHMHKMAEKMLSLGVAMIGLSAIGTFFVIPLLNIVSGGIIIYILHPLLPVLYRDLRAGRVSVEHLGMVIVAGALSQGIIFAASLNTLVVLARYALLARIKDDSMNEMIDVFRQQPRTAWMLVNGVEIEVDISIVKQGDLVIVTAGNIIPVDGRITEGVASIDQHILTGEAQPAEKQPGDEVFALTTVLSGQIQMAVEKAGEETTAAQIGEILNSTVDVKTDMQLWSESLSHRSVLPSMLLSAGLVPFIGTDSALAFLNTHPRYRSSVPCAFTLINYLNLATQHGVLVKDGRTLELLTSVDTVVFDKTGTLTEEKPHVGYVHACAELGQNTILTLAAAGEQRQTHPIARAIVEAAATQKLTLPEVDQTAYKVGYGLTVTINAQRVRVGSVRFIEMESIAIPNTIIQIQETCYSEGHSLVLVAVDNQVVGAVEIHATVRPEAVAVVQALRAQGIEAMYIISGDHEAPTRKLATTLGIDHYFAETLPENKADLIDKLQQSGKSVCYIGDGINDSIALKKAHISISMRGASTVATDTANIVLMDGTLNNLPLLFEMAQEYQGNMRQTFAVTLLPSLIGAGGALFLHWGLITTILLNQVGIVLGVGNAMRPRLAELLSNIKE